MPRFLADSSIWGWARDGRRPDIAEKLAERYERGDILTGAPVVLEVMHRARDGAEYDQVYEDLFGPLDWVPLGPATGDRAIEVQRELAQTTYGNHLRPAVDYLLAAAAEVTDDLVFWFFDKDLRIICEHTGQPYEAESSR